MIFLKIKEKPSENTKFSFISYIVSPFCVNLFSSAKISLVFFLVLLSILVTSVAIC